MKLATGHSRQNCGTAMVIVLALLALMTLIVILNARTLHVLKGELSLIEKRQQQHWADHGAAK